MGCRWKNHYKTSSKTIQAFVDVFKGPIFNIHYKYSFMLAVTYVVMLYGAGQPILFPLAFIAICTQYTLERMLIAYSYIQPPMIDSSLNQTTIYWISVSPIIYAFTSAWVFSNQQVFKNKVVVNKGDYLYADSDHYFVQFLTQITPGTPFVIYFFILGIFIIFRDPINYYRKKVLDYPVLNAKHMILDQDLGVFWNVLKPKVKDVWLKEEAICTARLDMPCLTQQAF